MEVQIPQKYIFLILGVSASVLFVLILFRTFAPISWYSVVLDWSISITIIVLEVGGIGLFLHWILFRRWKQSTYLQRQIALERIFVTLYNNVYKGIETTKSIQEQQVWWKTYFQEHFPNEEIPEQEIDKLSYSLAIVALYQRRHSIEDVYLKVIGGR